VENLGQRPYIRRTSNISITYDSGHRKAARANEVIKQLLAEIPEINQDTERPPRVYFNEFNDSSLNIYELLGKTCRLLAVPRGQSASQSRDYAAVRS
jgi:small-conductance mechanosensitive channel